MKEFFKGVNQYWNEVHNIRFEKITGLMKKSTNLKLIITYDSTLSEKLLTEFSDEPIGEPWYSVINRVKY